MKVNRKKGEVREGYPDRKPHRKAESTPGIIG